MCTAKCWEFCCFTLAQLSLTAMPNQSSTCKPAPGLIRLAKLTVWWKLCHNLREWIFFARCVLAACITGGRLLSLVFSGWRLCAAILHWSTWVTIQSLQTRRDNGYLSLGQPNLVWLVWKRSILWGKRKKWTSVGLESLTFCLVCWFWAQKPILWQ